MNIKKSAQKFLFFASGIGGWQATQLFVGRLFSTRVINIRIKGIKTLVKCRPAQSDRSALGQIFIDRDCDIPISYSPRLIIDGGANVGYASILLANKYPEAVILAVEPDSENLKMAKENCRAYPNIRLIQGGIWSSDTYLTIQNPADASWAFRVKPATQSSPGALRGLSLGTLLKESGFTTIDILKLDVEGAEEEIFSHPDSEWLDHVNNLIIEVHGDSAHRAVMAAISGHSFSRAQIGEKLIFTRI